MKKLFISAPLALLLLLVAGPLAAQSGYQMVVNAANPQSAITKSEVARLLLKKTKSWSNGLKVAPVDQAPSRSVRETFTRDVHNKPVSAIKAFWQKMIFSGRAIPPPEMASDNEVMTYVRNNSGGIGYVSADATVGSGLKTLLVN